MRVIDVSREDALYGPDGNRAVGPPLRFGRGVLAASHAPWTRVRRRAHGLLPVLLGARGGGGAATGRVPARDRLARGVEHARTGATTWAGRRGASGYAVQRRCVRVRQRAFCFSRLLPGAARRGGPARARDGARGRVRGLARAARAARGGRRSSSSPAATSRRSACLRCRAAIARARARGLDVRGLILGDGPERPVVLAEIAALGLEGIVEAPGFVDSEVVDDALRRALCLLHPSSREGYGLVVVEASAHGTPAVVVAGPDNAAVELVEPGVNGFVARVGRRRTPRRRADRGQRRGARAARAHLRVVRRERGAAVAGAVAGAVVAAHARRRRRTP